MVNYLVVLVLIPCLLVTCTAFTLVWVSHKICLIIGINKFLIRWPLWHLILKTLRMLVSCSVRLVAVDVLFQQFMQQLFLKYVVHLIVNLLMQQTHKHVRFMMLYCWTHLAQVQLVLLIAQQVRCFPHYRLTKRFMDQLTHLFSFLPLQVPQIQMMYLLMVHHQLLPHGQFCWLVWLVFWWFVSCKLACSCDSMQREVISFCSCQCLINVFIDFFSPYYTRNEVIGRTCRTHVLRNRWQKRTSSTFTRSSNCQSW